MANSFIAEGLSYCLRQDVAKKVRLNIVREKLKNNEFIINYEKLYSKVRENLAKYQGEKSYREIILSTDLTCLFPNVEINNFFSCYFFKGNLAWISEQNNHYRYFSRYYNGKIISFDLIDFTMLYYDLNNITEVIARFTHKSNITSLDDYWRNTQIEKYNSNATFVNNIEKICLDYPTFYKLFVSHKELFLFMNNQGIENLLCKYASCEKDAIFFTSTSYVANKLNISQGKASKVINFLCLLGVLRKIPQNLIPKNMLKKSKELAKIKNHKNIINYYLIFDISSNLDDFEETAKIADANCVKYSNISKKKIRKVFGEYKANIVYPQ